MSLPDARPLTPRVTPRALAVGVALLLGWTLPAGARDRLQGDDQRIVQVLTVDGTTVEGRVVGGILTVRTAAGVRAIEARRVTTFTGTLLKLDDGLSFMGSLEVAGGEVRVRTAAGEALLPAKTIRAIQSGQVLLWSLPSAPTAEGPADAAFSVRALVGRWRDSSGVPWEFLDDGTLITQQMTGRYRLIGPLRLEILFPEPFLGMRGARAYDILSAGEDVIVWAYQGSRSRLTRIK